MRAPLSNLLEAASSIELEKVSLSGALNLRTVGLSLFFFLYIYKLYHTL